MSIFSIKRCAISAMTELKSRRSRICKGDETWRVKSAIFKLGGPKSQVYET